MKDIKATTGHRPMFGDEHTAKAWAKACREKQLAQVVPYACAPSCSIQTHDGRRLGPGDEFQAERDLVEYPDRRVHEDGTPHTISGASLPVQLQRLIDQGIVLERDSAPVLSSKVETTSNPNYRETRLG